MSTIRPGDQDHKRVTLFFGLTCTAWCVLSPAPVVSLLVLQSGLLVAFGYVLGPSASAACAILGPHVSYLGTSVRRQHFYFFGPFLLFAAAYLEQ